MSTHRSVALSKALSKDFALKSILISNMKAAVVEPVITITHQMSNQKEKEHEVIVITQEYQDVIDSIDRKDPVIFVNGKAGTGKSTLIHHLIEKLEKENKSVALVAPTGAAAIQIGGVTINSLFRFPPSVISLETIRKPKTGAEIFQKLDILVIDEVSMADCNKIDAIDIFLRKVRGSKVAFGGVQLVLVGDLFQLSQVITKDDSPLLRQMGYDKGFNFFEAKILLKLPLKQVELNHVFRQPEREFADLLNKIRLAEDVPSVVNKLNAACYSPQKELHPMAVTLTTTNAVADSINSTELAKLPGAAVTFSGVVTNDFGRVFPVPEKLQLKIGARVMFGANDSSYRKRGRSTPRWANGSLGVVMAIRAEEVDVKMSNGTFVTVESHTWNTQKYVLKAGSVKREVVGNFKQIPLTLAWAITIHKGQGKSLDYVHIDLGTGTFSPGQAYVALSRCRTKEGMSFARPLRVRDVVCNMEIKKFFADSRSTQLF